jgi:hypothetical protein
MLTLGELPRPDNYDVVFTDDIEDCLMVTIPLVELFDFSTFTVVENVLKDCVVLPRSNRWNGQHRLTTIPCAVVSVLALQQAKSETQMNLSLFVSQQRYSK